MIRSVQLIPAVLMMSGLLFSAETTVLFDTRAATTTPYPSDTLAVTDPSQKTGLRMNLPLPDCTAEPSTCKEINLINELDGFSLTPRISVRFSGPVNVGTLRNGLFVVWLDDLTNEEFGLQPAGHVSTMNETLYDPATNTAYAKPDEFLSQHRRYLVVVTDEISDTAGTPVMADASFQSCKSQQDGYCGQLARAVMQVSAAFTGRTIVAASLFTTLSATAWLEKARDQLELAPIGLQWTGSKSVFKVSELASFTAQHQTKVNPPGFAPWAVPLYMLDGVGRVAFGSYLSPRFLNEDYAIPATPTGQDVALPAATERLHFHLFLPDSPAPPGGYPVVIAPGSVGGTALKHATTYASSFARHGLATITMNCTGSGYGPEGKIQVQDRLGNKFDFPFGGRGRDNNGDNTLLALEGSANPPNASVPVGFRDSNRQCALDLHQLVRAIRAGIDADGDGAVDLDRNRISFQGMCAATGPGQLLAAISPDVATAVFEGSGGSIASVSRWNKESSLLAARKPSLLNKGNTFDEDYVLRYRQVEIIDVPGALAIQEFFERYEWLHQPGEPLAYAPHLRQSTLPGVPIKRVLFQYAKGDTVVPNPAETAKVRAANMRETASVYRHDLALQLFPKLHPAGHYFAIPVAAIVPAVLGAYDPLGQYLIATLSQDQAAGFLASDGTVIPDMNTWSKLWFGSELFEVAPEFLTEDLNR